MTSGERERRLRLLQGAAVARHPDPPASDLEQWAAALSYDQLRRAEVLCRAMAADPERDDNLLSELERALVECACLDAEHGDADPVRRSYLASQPHDPTAPAMAELRDWIERWIADLDRQFMHGADVRGWLAWNGIVIDALSAGELVRLAALLRAFEDQPIAAAAMQSDALWAVVGRDGQRKRHGMA